MKCILLQSLLLGLIGSSIITTQLNAMEQHTMSDHKPLFTQAADDLGKKLILDSLMGTSITTLFTTISSLRYVSPSWNKLFNKSSFMQLICEHATYPTEYYEIEEKFVRLYIDHLVSKKSLSSNDKTFITCLKKKQKLHLPIHDILKKFQDTFTQEDEIQANEYLMILCLYLAFEFHYWDKALPAITTFLDPTKTMITIVANASPLFNIVPRMTDSIGMNMLKTFTEHHFISANTEINQWFNDLQTRFKLLLPSDNQQNTTLIKKLNKQNALFIKLAQGNDNTANTIYASLLEALDLPAHDHAFLEAAQKGNVEYINQAITKDNAYSCQLILDLALLTAVCFKQSKTADILTNKIFSVTCSDQNELLMRFSLLNVTLPLAIHTNNIKRIKACISYITKPKVTDDLQHIVELVVPRLLIQVRSQCLVQAPSRKIFELLISHELFNTSFCPIKASEDWLLACYDGNKEGIEKMDWVNDYFVVDSIVLGAAFNVLIKQSRLDLLKILVKNNRVHRFFTEAKGSLISSANNFSHKHIAEFFSELQPPQ